MSLIRNSRSPTPKASVHARSVPNDFKSDLYDCLNDTSICYYGLFCPTCLAAENWAAANHETCSLVHWLFLVSPFWTRQILRKRYEMPQAICEDCLTYTFCCYCAICQDARELQNDKKQ